MNDILTKGYVEQQSIEVATPEIYVQVEGDDPYLLWAVGVIVPLLVTAMGLWFQRSHMKRKKE